MVEGRETLAEFRNRLVPAKVNVLEYRDGLLEKRGRRPIVHIAQKIIKYHPKWMYLIHWKGWPKTARTWERPMILPKGQGFEKQMDKARKAYYQAKLAKLALRGIISS